MLPLKRRFHLTPWEQEVVVSSTVLAAFVSSLFVGGYLNNHWGRRLAIMTAALVFTLGSGMLFVAWSFHSLVLGRIVVGLGIGIASLTTPIYIAEVAMPHLRGQLVTCNALLVTIGQFSAGMVDGLLDQWLPNQGGWRYMLGLAALPSILMFLGFYHLPESPRWLAMKGRKDEALAILKSLRESDVQAEQELHEILESVVTVHNKNITTKDRHHHQLLGGSDDSASHEGCGGGLELAADTSADPATTRSLEYGSTALEPRSVEQEEQEQQQNAQEQEPGTWQRFQWMLADPPTRRALVVGCGLMVVQQCSGINTVSP
jgi:Sugar (and other) transporter